MLIYVISIAGMPQREQGLLWICSVENPILIHAFCLAGVSIRRLDGLAIPIYTVAQKNHLRDRPWECYLLRQKRLYKIKHQSVDGCQLKVK